MARPTETDSELGQAVRQLRDEHSLTQEDLAHDADITVAALSRLERAETNPSWATVRRVAAAFDVTVAELAERADRLRR